MKLKTLKTLIGNGFYLKTSLLDFFSPWFHHLIDPTLFSLAKYEKYKIYIFLYICIYNRKISIALTPFKIL